MSVSPLGSIAGLNVAPTAPAAPAMAGTQGVLPFMLLPLATPPPTQGPSPELAPPAAEDADEPGDNTEAPLIGWLFDCFALAPQPQPMPQPPPATSPAPDLALSARESPLAVLAAPQQSTSQQPQQPIAIPRAGMLVAAAADPAAAVVQSPAESMLDMPIDPRVESLAPTTAAPTSGGVDMSSAQLPSNAPMAFAAASAIPPSPPTVTPVPPSVPVDGAPPPLVADGPDFGAELGERIAWQMDQGLGEATIELHPAELGALTIRIETQAQQAQVHILAAEPAARALLSQCLPQLRELLGASGLTLTRGQVEAAERRVDDGVGLPSPRSGRRRVASVSLVDAYA